MVELLAALALAVTHQPVGIHCGVSPFPDGFRGALAYAAGPPAPQIWMRTRVCQRAAEGRRDGLWVFAHECLHVIHPTWPETRVQRWDNWYAENVVRWKLRRLAVPAGPDVPVGG